MPNPSKGTDDNVIQLGFYRHKAARQRRRAWWAALLFRARPEKTAGTNPTPDFRNGAVVKFRRQAAAGRW